MGISDFFPSTTKNFSINLKINGVTQDITGDTVTVRFKKSKDDLDVDSVISLEADVITQGATGVALFKLTPLLTTVPPLKYYVDITWLIPATSSEYVVYSQIVTILRRTSDA